jgi:hypothetical protein
MTADIAEGRRKKEEAVIAIVLAVKNVLTVLAVAILCPLEPARSNWFVVRNEVLTTCLLTVILADTISDSSEIVNIN